MRQEAFAMPMDSWGGLHAPQYIVRAYRLKFEPTASAVKKLNQGDAIASHPQGLVYMLGEPTYTGQYDRTHRDILVFATDEAYFEQYAIPAMSAMEDEVESVRRAETVKAWYASETA